jgi:hypothetical protein
MFSRETQVVVGKGCLRIFVQVIHVLFDILAVVAFAVRQTKEALLEYWISAIPYPY